MRYRHRPSTLVGDINISMNIQHAGIISEMPDVPHIGPWPRNRPPQNIAGHAWPSAYAGPMGPNVGEIQRDVVSATETRRIPIRCVGTPFRNKPGDSETDFPTYKIHIGGRTWSQSQTGRDGEARRIFCCISAYSESCFNSALSCTDRM